ncbi:MAG: hypothetical protein V2A73_04835 [Pseudomonadota bacterium]
MAKISWAVPLVGLVGLNTACACSDSTPTATRPEVVETQVKLDLPAPPAFERPRGYPDGSHSVAEMRRFGTRFLNQDVTVKGHVTWVYDCVAALGEKVVKDTPERCEKPHFYLGDTADSPQHRCALVVEVPRPPREDEKRFLPKEDLAKWPEVPTIAIGDLINIEGKWVTSSPQGFMDSNGLLVYGKMTSAN